MNRVHKVVRTPVGALTLVGGDAGLAAILWEDDRPDRVRLDRGPEAPDHPALIESGRQLAEYFAGSRTAFTVALDLSTGTEFQQAVWRALRTIPYGETRTYGQIAAQIGRATAVRAVGAANGKNPLSIVAPCHRVIGSTGKLTGFAGGLAVKQHLLDLESRANLADAPWVLTSIPTAR